MTINSEFIEESGIGEEPYKAEAPSYEISIDCYDFTDSSECNINLSSFSGSCTNVTFDDDPIIGDSGEDLDIGVLLCINESSSYYDLTFTRWGYEAGHMVGVRYCINSTYGVNDCSGWVLNNTATSYNYNHLKTITGGIYNKSFSQTSNSGQHDIIIYAVDSTDLINDSETTFFYVDESIPPLVYLENPINSSTEDNAFVIFEYNVTDNEGDIANCSLIINGTINETDYTIRESITQAFGSSGLKDGDYLWSVSCTDEVGNTNNSETITFTILDTSAPLISLFEPSNETNSNNDDFVFEYGVSDGYDLANCSLIINGAIEKVDTNITSNFERFSVYNLTTGQYLWSINCTDNSPSKNTGASATFVLDVSIESVPPFINLVSPNNNFIDRDGEIDFTFNATDLNNASGLSSCKLIINGLIVQTRTNFVEGSSQIFNWTLEDGEYIWGVNCTDNFWNEGASDTMNLTVSLDLSAPVITLLTPDYILEQNNSTILFSFNVTDDSSIDNCSLILNDIINETSFNISIGTNSFLKWISDDSYNWKIECYDNLSNNGSSTYWNLTIDTKPAIALNTPDVVTDSDGDVTFNFTVTDNIGLRNCSLYTNISGTWEINITNTFVQPNVSLYLTIENVLDDTTVKWNILCYDSDENENWGVANRTIIIDNTAPSLDNIPNTNWDEDDYTTINLSAYFSDVDGDTLGYNSTISENITVIIDNITGIATLRSDINWDGSRNIIFSASDGIESTNSNSVTLTVNYLGDTSPKIISSPVDNEIDTDGYLFLMCNITDDYNLVNVSLYHNISGTWQLSQTMGISGIDVSTEFNVSGAAEADYLWGCLAYDNNSQSTWGINKTISVDITANLTNDFPTWMVNNVNTSRYVVISYSSYLNESLVLGNLSIFEADGEMYYSKDMSNSSSFNSNSLTIHPQLIDIIPNEIFDDNFSFGNTAGLNLSIIYYYQGNTYEIRSNITIDIVSETQW